MNRGIPIKIQSPSLHYPITVGYLLPKKEGRIFLKEVERAKHFMRILEGYGIQKEVYDTYLRGKRGKVVIEENDTGKFLCADISTWQEHSSAQNYGDGKQIFLSERYMNHYDTWKELMTKEYEPSPTLL